MKIDYDQMLKDCDKHMGSCSLCDHYAECRAKFPEKDKMNNPSMLFWEIQNNTLSYEPKISNNYIINITEVPEEMLNHNLKIIENLPLENRKIVQSALEKYVASKQEDATISSIKDNMYHFIFKCTDCSAINDFTDYCLNNEVHFHCRYCGKKHRFIINKENKE